jgi:adenylosuccinate lyase
MIRFKIFTPAEAIPPVFYMPASIDNLPKMTSLLIRNSCRITSGYNQIGQTMIKRYAAPRITEIWSLERKFKLWEMVELAVVQGRESLGKIRTGIHSAIARTLSEHDIDIAFIDEREKVLQHDLNAFLEERQRFLPPELQAEFHRKMTSYDTEEAPFAKRLMQSCDLVQSDAAELLEAIKDQAIRYRYTPMNARTHGQEAEMQSFGKRCLTWYVDLRTARNALMETMGQLCFSKLSGAIGTNSGIEPELEEASLKILGFKPWPGATQIMPRILYAPIAGALSDLVLAIDKIATDIRLGSRSGRPLWHEPFGRQQKGSSAMPHKKNNVLGEKIEGMAVMACHYSAGIKQNIKTWEERAIAQSSVERVFWPDLFHVTLHAIKTMNQIMDGLVVYPDTMMLEIIESRGCYASNEAKESLLELGTPFGLTREEAYRIVQLACFNAFEPKKSMKILRKSPSGSLESADMTLNYFRLEMQCDSDVLPSIESIIAGAQLSVSGQLEADQASVDAWNGKLKSIFNPSFPEQWAEWNLIFKPSHILANEAHLFKEVFGV